MILKCPGQDSRNIKAKVLKCPACAGPVEIFSDEVKRRCPTCSRWVFQHRLSSCRDWCKGAKDCAGKDIMV